MYKLAIYFLASLILLGFILSLADVLPYGPWQVVLPSLYLVSVAYLANLVLAKIFKTKDNPDSAVITALILSLIVGPQDFLTSIGLLTFMAVVAMASKYLLAWRGRHVFNPAALAVVVSAIVLGQGASWWVGDVYLVPLVALVGLVLLQKIGREKLVGSFLLTYFVLTLLLNPGLLSSLNTTLDFIWQLLAYSPILFFALVMLSEPQTSPKRSGLRVVYGVVTAAIVVLYQKYLSVPYTLELGLLTGNIFAYVTSRDLRTTLSLVERREIKPGIFSLWFKPSISFNHAPGQFLEWTLPHISSDSRGIRRYFTVASSSTESNILLTVKVPEQSSSFKKALLKLEIGEQVIATGPEGEFILPDQKDKKLVFIAGGVGITPFRSMVKYLIDKGESRDIALIYSAKTAEELVFGDIFTDAQDKFGLKVVHVLSDETKVPADWSGKVGFITSDLIKSEVSDWQQRLFYISGPEPMVKALEANLSLEGINKSHIKHDYFPGYEEI